MGGDEAGATPEASPAALIAAQRAELVALLAELPETRLSKLTQRHGWTLRHELAWVAAADEELLQRLDPALGSSNDDAHWRRVRGEAMHAAQELRLAALCEHLEASGNRVVAALEEHADRLGDPSIRDAVSGHAKHGQTAVDALRAVLAK